LNDAKLFGEARQFHQEAASSPDTRVSAIAGRSGNSGQHVVGE
jgi:hypothetical protein